MKKSFSLILAALLVCLPLSGCGSSAPNGEVNVLNWGEYISDGQDGTLDVCAKFTEETGIQVNYKVCSDNETLYAGLKQGDSYDVIIPSDYMISRLIEEDMLEPLNFDNIPNAGDVAPTFLKPAYDPDNIYSVPYMWGTVGIIYNTSLVDEEITSWSALFDQKYAKQVLMINNSRDAIGVALKYLGYSYNTTDPAQLQAAIDLLAKQKDDGILQAKVMDEIFGKMENEEAAIGVYYAGDYLTMRAVNPNLAFVVPAEGSNIFTDAMCIPAGAANRDNAERFINFMCSTEAGLANCEATGYSTPLTSVLSALDPAVSADPVAYPPDDVLARCEPFLALPQDVVKTYYTDKWLKLGA